MAQMLFKSTFTGSLETVYFSPKSASSMIERLKHIAALDQDERAWCRILLKGALAAFGVPFALCTTEYGAEIDLNGLTVRISFVDASWGLDGDGDEFVSMGTCSERGPASRSAWTGVTDLARALSDPDAAEQNVIALHRQLLAQQSEGAV